MIKKPLNNLVDSDTAILLEVFGATASAGIGANFSFNFVLNLLMSTSMNQMLSSIKALQVVIHLCLMTVIMPGNANILFGALAEFVAFDPVDVTDAINTMFDLEEEMELERDNFVQLFYESPYGLVNIGSLLFIIMFYFILIIQLSIVAIMPCCHGKVKDWTKRRLSGIFFNSFLTFFDGAFFIIFIMAMLNIQQ